jgi:hypothetical protein
MWLRPQQDEQFLARQTLVVSDNSTHNRVYRLVLRRRDN